MRNAICVVFAVVVLIAGGILFRLIYVVPTGPDQPSTLECCVPFVAFAAGFMLLFYPLLGRRPIRHESDPDYL